MQHVSKPFLGAAVAFVATAFAASVALDLAPPRSRAGLVATTTMSDLCPDGACTIAYKSGADGASTVVPVR